ncbi:unnamed protein product [Boreogadus saida]
MRNRCGTGRIAFPPPKVGVTRTLPYPTRHHSGDCSVAVIDILSYEHTKRVPAYDIRGIKKHVAAVAALESEVGNPNAAVCGCMIEFRSAFVVLISREIVRQDVEVA